MKYNMNQWFADMLANPVKKPLPVLAFPAVQLLNISVHELVTSADLLTKAMVKVAAEVNAAAAVSFMDLSVEAECFGASVLYSDNEVPTVTGSLITDENEAYALEIPSVEEGRTALYLKAVESASDIIYDKPVFAGSIGPFSLAGRLLDVSEALALCYEEPELVHIVLKKATQFIIAYLSKYKEKGANGVLMAEPLAGLLPPALSWEFSGQYVAQIVKAVQDDYFAIVYHNCGPNTVLMSDDIIRTGAMAYHFGNAIDLNDMLEKVPADVPVLGNIDPSAEIRSGTTESVRDAVIKLMQSCSKYPNFILSTGCDIPPTAKWDNIHSFFDAADEFYAK